MTSPPPSLAHPDAVAQMTARVAAAVRDVPRLAAAEVDDLLRLVPGKRAILRGRLGGRDTVFRLNLAPDDGTTAREWAEMLRLWPVMNTGDLRIPEPICASAAHGIIAQAHVPGTPLLQLFYGSEPQERIARLSPAAAWLRRSTVISEGWQSARPERWIARARRASQTQPFSQLRALELEILEQMQRIAPLVAAAPWRTAICHGDYHPNNLLADGTRLTGIDLGFSQRMPVLKDIARFAMHMGRRRLRLSGRTRFGVDDACLSAFAEAFDLTAAEREATLPFFLGFEALIRVENVRLPQSRILRAEKMYRGLLRDLIRTPQPRF
jgi:hypothetical protein